MRYFDICIIGGGHTGLVATLAFANKKLNVLCVEKKSFNNNNKRDLELRTTAHLMPAVNFLNTIGVWKHLESHSCPLNSLNIINSRDINNYPSKISENTFEAREIGKDCFGYNVPLEKSIKILRELVLSKENAELLEATSLISSSLDGEFRIAQLSNGEVIKTKLIIGADGSNSVVRDLSNISTFERDTRQTALTFNAKHEIKHCNVSYEIYKFGGPLTTVPISDEFEGMHSSIVWMNKEDYTKKLLNCSKKEFSLKLKERSLSILGEISPITNLVEIPVKFMVAKKLISERIALIGEAAHKLPPIGAQGFNISVKDIETIVNLSIDYPNTIGCFEMLNKYQLKRLPEILGKSWSVGLLNILAGSERIPLQNFRAIGLEALNNSSFLKKTIMRFGLG